MTWPILTWSSPSSSPTHQLAPNPSPSPSPSSSSGSNRSSLPWSARLCLGSVDGLHGEVGWVQRIRHKQYKQQARDRCDSLLDSAGGSVGDHRVRHGLAGVRYLVRVANEKMEANRIRTQGFLRALQNVDMAEPKPELESEACSDEDEHSGADLSVLRVVPIMVSDEEVVEKLYLWGHSACSLASKKKVLVFGWEGIGEGCC